MASSPGARLRRNVPARGTAVNAPLSPSHTQPERRRVFSLAIELTAVCNQKCDYCYNEWRDDGGRGIAVGDTGILIARVSKLLDAWELDHVTLTGGEPLAHRGVFSLLDLLRERGVGVQMISNGGLVTDTLAARLAEYCLRFVQVTLNGADRELHEAHVGEGHFDRTLRGVAALSRHGVPMVGCVVVTRRNAAQVGKILELWASFGVRHIALSRFSPAGYAASFVASLLPSRSDMVIAFEQALPFARERGMEISCTMPIPPCVMDLERYAPIRFGGCAIGGPSQEFALAPDGRLRNCTLHKTALGGVSDILDPGVDVRALLDAPEVIEYRRRVPDFCRGCTHELTCAGGCGAAAEWVLGDARAHVDPFVAQYVDQNFESQLAAARSNGRRRLEVIL